MIEVLCFAAYTASRTLYSTLYFLLKCINQWLNKHDLIVADFPIFLSSMWGLSQRPKGSPVSSLVPSLVLHPSPNSWKYPVRYPGPIQRRQHTQPPHQFPLQARLFRSLPSCSLWQGSFGNLLFKSAGEACLGVTTNLLPGYRLAAARQSQLSRWYHPSALNRTKLHPLVLLGWEPQGQSQSPLPLLVLDTVSKMSFKQQEEARDLPGAPVLRLGVLILWYSW